MKIRSFVLATALVLALPLGVQAETKREEAYEAYRVSCSEESVCNTFDVDYEEANEVAQARRTRTRTTRSRRSDSKIYAGFSAGLLFEDFLDLGFQVGGFGGYKFNDYIGVDGELLFALASFESDFIDDTLTVFGFFINPRFEYEFDDSGITAFASPGFGLGIFSNFDDSDSEFGFQFKAGASYAVSSSFDAYGQLRFQDIEGYDPFFLEGGLIFDL